MKHDLICSWLGLSPGKWPPDHYALLGLPRGEVELSLVEKNVQERLARLRSYQISHAEEATEGMNRLAQAYLCLTDASSRKGYDSSLGAKKAGGLSDSQALAATREGKTGTVAPVPTLPPAVGDTAVGSQTTVEWRSTAPPPVRVGGDPAGSGTGNASPPSNGSGPVPLGFPSGSSAGTPYDAIYELAHTSLAARKGLGTLGTLFDRIVHTRQLLWTWLRLGRYFGKPERRLTRPAEEAELARRLTDLQELIDGFPAILGQPGLPGYRVVAMARLSMMVPLFNHLETRQREALAGDWKAGLALLQSHRQFLRGELKALRKRGWLGQAARATRSFVAEHPGWILLGLFAGLAGILWLSWP